MADTKITALTALTGANLATGDQAVVVDVSDTTMAASGTDKKMSASELSLGVASLLSLRGGSLHMPSGAIGITTDRSGGSSAQTILTSGTLNMASIDLVAGMVITSISFKSGGTAAGTPTHQWFGIADVNRAVQRWTNDDTTTAWGALVVKTLNLTSTYTVPSTGTYYLAIMVAATTTPNIMCSSAAVSNNVSNIAPVVMGNTSDTGLTTPPTIPFTAGAITAGSILPIGWVS